MNIGSLPKRRDKELISRFRRHEEVYCPFCAASLASAEVTRSGLGIEGGRYRKYCQKDGFIYYNLINEVGK